MEPSVRPGGRVLSLALPLLRIADGVRLLLKQSAEAEGLTPAQAQTLRFVARTKTFMTSIGNLAAALGVTHVTAVKVAGVLERRGLLERVQSGRDRRVTLLRLTAEGEEVVERLGSWERALEQVTASLPGRGRERLEPLLGAVVRSLAEAGALAVSEPCRGCRYFVENAFPGNEEPHRCELIRASLSEAESRRDCPDHLPAAA